MLVLSRKQGESLRIGPDVIVKIVRIGPNAVRIGIDAPKDVNVVRTEIDHGREHGPEETR